MPANMLAVAQSPSLAFRAPMAANDGDQRDREAERRAKAKAVGRALKRMREQSGMTQEEAAEKVGITRTAYQNYENGREAVLDGDLQQRLADALGGDRLELLEAENPHLLAHRSSEVHEAATPFEGPTRRTGRAVFPLDEGDVVISFPPELSPEGRERLADYLTVWLKRRPS